MEDIEKRSQQFFTSCKDCGFAEFSKLENVETQIGCKVDRLEKWQKLNKISTLFDEKENKEYYQINAFCNYLRPMEYIAKFTDPAAQVRIENAAQFSVVINALGVPDDDLVRIIDSLTAQTLKPSKIVVMHYKRQSAYGQISEVLRHNSIPYELVNLLDSDDQDKLMDAAVKKCTGQYVTFINTSIPLEFFERINKIINEDLQPVSMITGKYFTVQINLYNLLMGNLGQSIQSKIEEMAERQELQHMILKCEDVCQ